MHVLFKSLDELLVLVGLGKPLTESLHIVDFLVFVLKLAQLHHIKDVDCGQVRLFFLLGPVKGEPKMTDGVFHNNVTIQVVKGRGFRFLLDSVLNLDLISVDILPYDSIVWLE